MLQGKYSEGHSHLSGPWNAGHDSGNRRERMSERKRTLQSSTEVGTSRALKGFHANTIMQRGLSLLRGCTKRLLVPRGMYELLQPGKPFQKQTAGVFVQIGFHSQRKWLHKPMETEQFRQEVLECVAAKLVSPHRTLLPRNPPHQHLHRVRFPFTEIYPGHAFKCS